MPKPAFQTRVYRPMVRVFCPKANVIVWANPSKSGPRCTTCSLTGHTRV